MPGEYGRNLISSIQFSQQRGIRNTHPWFSQTQPFDFTIPVPFSFLKVQLLNLQSAQLCGMLLIYRLVERGCPHVCSGMSIYQQREGQVISWCLHSFGPRKGTISQVGTPGIHRCLSMSMNLCKTKLGTTRRQQRSSSHCFL